MQDRLLMRVFDPVTKNMCYDMEQIYTQLKYVAQGFSQEDLKVMQCTGLPDKKGKLIYEGDILKVNTGSRDTSGYGVIEYLQPGCKFVVNGFLDNRFPYNPRRKGELFLSLKEWLCTEVIGNIYENPDLLEVDNANRRTTNNERI